MTERAAEQFNVGPSTFDAIIKKLAGFVDLSKLTSKQIGAIIAFGYNQKQYGSTEMWKEMKS